MKKRMILTFVVIVVPFLSLAKAGCDIYCGEKETSAARYMCDYVCNQGFSAGGTTCLERENWCLNNYPRDSYNCQAYYNQGCIFAGCGSDCSTSSLEEIKKN